MISNDVPLSCPPLQMALARHPESMQWLKGLRRNTCSRVQTIQRAYRCVGDSRHPNWQFAVLIAFCSISPIGFHTAVGGI